MHWTEPASADDSHFELEKQLWDAANQLWANAALKRFEFPPVVLGLIFLRYADVRFPAAHEEWDEDKELGRWVNTQRIH
ncbi:type I restriction-modification system subunit M N-terminal domain-containing protein [Haloferula sp. A504]|uniref:type I restriction-modification system subunit M N-terminal domain-containing protein n=1 Tax=Haloferula sp. A504 TaxID=3373601 RepID=UPI0031CBA2A5|nr:type I restriction-modification system subunit M N-terminal domain-containing protein [Verrucomicrobiaceae bacterium E54]